MKRNIELLTRVRDLIRAEPHKLDMQTWATAPAAGIEFTGHKAKISCGTTACIAGWAVQLAGDKLLAIESDRRNIAGAPVLHVGSCVAKNGRAFDISPRARKLLGLADGEANILFMCSDDQAVDFLNVLIAGEVLDDEEDYEDCGDWDDDDDE